MFPKREYTKNEIEAKQEDFDLFLFNMDDVLEHFVDIALKSGYMLDYSFERLDQLEAYLLFRQVKRDSEYHIWASQYYGETVRKVFGGKWQLSLDWKNNSLHYGQAVIIGYCSYDTEFPPYDIIHSFLVRHQPGLLKQAVLADVNPQPLDLSDLPTEAEPTNDE